MKKRLISVAFALLGSVPAFTQTDTDPDSVKILRDIVVDSYRLKEASVQVSTLSATSGNLAELLNINMPIYFKFNGPGMSSTISYRGAGAERTNVMWNGVNIQNAMLGQFDFSLAPVGEQFAIRFYSGSSGARYGSGGLSGTISLDQPAKFGKDFSVRLQQEYGAFRTWRSYGYLKLSGNNFFISTQYNRVSSANNFTFRDIAQVGFPVVHQVNGAYTMHSLTHTMTFRREFHHFKADFWFQEATREIPPVTGAANAFSRQYDRAYRSMLSYYHAQGGHRYQASAGFFDEQLDYGDIYIESRSNLKTLMVLFTGRNIISTPLEISYTVDYQWLIPKLTDYEKDATQHRGSASVELVHWIKSLRLNFLARYQLISDYTTLPVGSMDITWRKKLKKENSIILNFNAGNAYRVPTLNDRFWSPGGNPNLQPESGVNGELNLHWEKDLSYQNMVRGLKAGIAGYTNYITNYIQWQPVAQGYWSPVNHKRVFLAGTEITASWNWGWKDSSNIRAEGFYAYNYTANIDEAWASLIYAPTQLFGLNVTGSVKGFQYTLAGKYTGLRYTADDNLSYIKAYFLLDLDLGYELKLPWLDILFFARGKNLTNSEYQTVRNRPMPGISWSAGLSIAFNQIHIRKIQSKS